MARVMVERSTSNSRPRTACGRSWRRWSRVATRRSMKTDRCRAPAPDLVPVVLHSPLPGVGQLLDERGQVVTGDAGEPGVGQDCAVELDRHGPSMPRLFNEASPAITHQLVTPSAAPAPPQAHHPAASRYRTTASAPGNGLITSVAVGSEIPDPTAALVQLVVERADRRANRPLSTFATDSQPERLA